MNLSPARARSSRPRLARELLWNLALLSAAALSLAVATALVAQALQPRVAVLALIALIAADVGILVLFGRYLIGRLVLRPVRALMEAADAIAAGTPAVRAPPAETEELTRLAERLNEMTDALLDAQSQLVRAEKLAGIGRLAAGLAHEIGNPLAAIGTYVEVLRKRGVAPDVVDDVAREAERIDRIIKGLLAYARPGDPGEQVVEVGTVVESVVGLLTRQGVLKGRDPTVRVDPDLPPLRGRAHALEQVLVNLLLNALDASPAGEIVVGAHPWAYAPGPGDRRAADDPSGPTPARRPSGRRPRRSDLGLGAPGVLLFVADAGPGVPEADRERVFDPFFTTKPPGAGTGLGLAIVQRTVHEMGGLVWVEDAREGGAAFKVFLPSVRPSAGAGGGEA